MVTLVNQSEHLSPEEIDKATKEMKESNSQVESALDNATDSSTTRSTAKETPKGESPNKRAKFKTTNQSPQNASLNKRKPKSKEQYMDELKQNASQELDKQLKREADIKAFQSRQTARDEKLDGLGKKRGGITGLGLLGAAADGFFTYQNERAEDPNGSKLLDGLKAGAVAGAWLVAEGAMWGITLGGAAIEGGKMLYEDARENYDKSRAATMHVNKDESGSNKGTLGGTLIDNEYAATSRQRQEQIMRNHKISTESILGSEARQLHR